MENSTLSLALTGVVPAVCDAEAGAADGIVFDRRDSRAAPPFEGSGLPVRKIRSVMAELCSAIRSALDDERCTAEESLRRAVEILEDLGEAAAALPEPVGGGLAPWLRPDHRRVRQF